MALCAGWYSVVVVVVVVVAVGAAAVAAAVVGSKSTVNRKSRETGDVIITKD